MTIDTCQIHQYTQLDDDGVCPICSMNNTSREKFRYLVERYGSKSFRLGLTPDDEGRKQQHREAFDELMALAELFPENAKARHAGKDS